MAKIHGISGSTRYLVKGVRPVNGKNLEQLDEIQFFYDNYEKILADTERSVTQKQDELILDLSNEEVRRDRQLQDDIARRTGEVDNDLDELSKKIDTIENVFVFVGYKIKFWFARSMRNHRIMSPLSKDSQELRDVRRRKANTISNKPNMIRNECRNINNNHAFLKNNQSFLYGAHGEELAISSLARLSDEYHVINDVNLHFDRGIYWKSGNDRIYRCQIDHVVIGPTGIFLVETKNWKKGDIEVKSDELKRQVRRANFALWCQLHEKSIRNVVVSTHGYDPSKNFDKYIDVRTPHQLFDYITRREKTLPDDKIKSLAKQLPFNNPR